jgi:hypothetical protein
MQKAPARLGCIFVCGVALFLACEDETVRPPGMNLGPSNPGFVPGNGGNSPPPLLPVLTPAADPNTAMPGAGAAAIGAACREPSDCSSGLCLSGPKLPNGYCSRNCGGAVIAASVICPTGSACVKMGQSASSCLDLCGPGEGGCRDGYVCEARDGVSVCVSRCTGDRDCPTGLACDTAMGTCAAGGAKKPGQNGAACAGNNDCISADCLTEAESSAFAGGYCVADCTAANVNKPCAAAAGGGICVSAGNNAFLCVGACQTGADCRGEYMCTADGSLQASEGAGICLPRCDRYECKTGFVCDRTTGMCVTGGGPMGDPMGTPPAIERIDLGSAVFTAVAPAGQTKSISIDVTPGTASFSIVAKPANDGRILFGRLTAPNGSTLLDALDPTNSPMRVPIRGFPGTFSLIYPSSPRLPLLPGRYELLLWGQGMNSVKVDVLRKRQTGVVEGGSIPVVFWFTKQDILNAATAQTNAGFQSVIKIFSDIYASVGIKMGPFIYRDLPPGAAEKYAVIDSELDLIPGLFALADQSNDIALNFFMVEQFALEGGFTLLGVAGGIPGPPAFPGLGKSGVAVALGTVGADMAQLAETMAHEAGHYFGLFHTTERTGDSHDPLLDTPECPASNDRNNDDVVTSSECRNNGADNLMFWAASDQPQRKLTGDQRFVLFRNPSVQ